ncbi:carbamoyltransferase C-terminal domain-containing protein [Paenibacillus silvae]|nr:carbamoyltransferase C-terminal domain-containing protein [Paenibacillus silvae]
MDRSVAPIVLKERMDEWFSFFIYATYDLDQGRQGGAGAGGSHLDHLAWIQTMAERANWFLTSVVQAFYEKKGVPIVCNTSLK